MKNTRKKMLLSSVAMLLVALVALGAATYAWYTTNPNSTVSGLNMRTEAGKGLEVRSASEKSIYANAPFSHDAKLRAALGSGADVATQYASRTTSADKLTLDPASLVTAEGATYNSASAFATAIAANEDGPAKTGNYSGFSSDYIGFQTGKTLYEEEVEMKLTGGAASEDVYITSLKWDAPDYNPAKAVRVAIVDTDRKILKVFSSNPEQENKAAAQTGTETVTYETAARMTTVTNSKAAALKLGTADKDGTKSFKVIVFIDGEDEFCYNKAVNGSDVLNNLVITLKLGSEMAK